MLLFPKSLMTPLRISPYSDDLSKLKNYPNEVYSLLSKTCSLPERAVLARVKSIEAKIQILDDFYNGCKPWKSPKYRW